MSALSTIRQGKRPVPPKLLYYGVAGVGKSTVASEAPDPIFVFTEDSQGELDVLRFEPDGDPVHRTWEQVQAAVASLYRDEHPLKTLVIDTVDNLEPLLFDYVCRKGDKAGKGIESFGYGKGYVRAEEELRAFLSALDYLHREKGMAIVFVGHAELGTFTDADGSTYNRYALRMHKRLAPVIVDWCNTVLFTAHDKVVKTEEGSFGKTATKAVGSGQRIVLTEERPGHVAKNRSGAPYKIVLPRETGQLWETISNNLAFHPPRPDLDAPAPSEEQPAPTEEVEANNETETATQEQE